MKPTQQQLWTPEVKQCVHTYLLALTYAQVKREAVDKIERAILQDHPMMATLLANQRGYGAPYRIADPKDVFLCEDEAARALYHSECNRRERLARIKPTDMPNEHCPALCAEYLLTQAEWCLLQVTAPLWGMEWESVNSLPTEKRAQWIDLHVKLVLQCPGFDVALPRPALPVPPQPQPQTQTTNAN